MARRSCPISWFLSQKERFFVFSNGDSRSFLQCNQTQLLATAKSQWGFAGTLFRMNVAVIDLELFTTVVLSFSTSWRIDLFFLSTARMYLVHTKWNAKKCTSNFLPWCIVPSDQCTVLSYSTSTSCLRTSRERMEHGKPIGLMATHRSEKHSLACWVLHKYHTYFLVGTTNGLSGTPSWCQREVSFVSLVNQEINKGDGNIRFRDRIAKVVVGFHFVPPAVNSQSVKYLFDWILCFLQWLETRSVRTFCSTLVGPYVDRIVGTFQ